MSLYEVLKASRAQRFSDYWTLLWGRKLSAKMIKTLTGTLPLTFTTSETALRNWLIYGNNKPGRNLFNKDAKDTNNGYVAQSYIDIDGNIQTSSAWNVSEYIPISASTDYVYIWKLTSGTTQEPCLAIYDSTKTLIETKKYKDFDPDTIVPFTTPANAAFIRASWYNSYADQTMLTEGTTIPTVFIPYQIGVGGRTKNYANVETGETAAGVTFTVNPDTGTVTANGRAESSAAQCRIVFNDPSRPNNSTVPPGNYYFSGCPSGGGGGTYNCYSWDFNAGERSKKWDGTTSVDQDNGQGNCQVQINGHAQALTMRIASGYTANNVVFKPMLRAADTGAEFIPYGYEITLNVNGTPQMFYIGRTPLIAGQSISKESTSVDIATQVGENTIDTTLYNKPEMSITYKKGG